MPARISLSKYKLLLTEKYKGKLVINVQKDASFNYGKRHSHTCVEHNKKFYSAPLRLIHCTADNGCSHCKQKIIKRIASNKNTGADYLKICAERGITVVDAYENRFKSIRHQCIVDSHVWSTKPDNILSSNSVVNCPKCLYPLKYRTCEEWNTLTVPKGFNVLEIGHHLKVKYIECEHSGYKPIRTALQNPGCPICEREKTRQHNTMEYSVFIDRLSLKQPNLTCVTPECDWRGAAASVCIKCNLHDYKYTVSGYKAWSKGLCPKCNEGNKYKFYLHETNGEFKVLGYEPDALLWLKENKPKTYADIHPYSSGNVPILYYEHSRRKYKHFPDFYSPKFNRLIEVKSIYTLTKSTRVFNHAKSRMTAALNQGYDYKLLVIEDKSRKRIVLPENWQNYTAKGLRRQLARS